MVTESRNWVLERTLGGSKPTPAINILLFCFKQGGVGGRGIIQGLLVVIFMSRSCLRHAKMGASLGEVRGACFPKKN